MILARTKIETSKSCGRKQSWNTIITHPEKAGFRGMGLF